MEGNIGRLVGKFSFTVDERCELVTQVALNILLAGQMVMQSHSPEWPRFSSLAIIPNHAQVN